jgi:hypothetical protein
MSVPREYRAYVASELGVIPGEVSILVSSRTSNAGKFVTGKGVSSGSIYTSIYQAENITTTQRNDCILVTPESHAWRGDADATAAALTWDKTNTHVLGMSPASKPGYSRSRFSHSGYTMANFMTVSGDENKFKNIRFMHGSSTGGASDVTCITVTGAGNVFEKVAFAGPNNATQAASNNYKGVQITGSHNYFKDCMFGSVNDVDRSGTGGILYFGAACGAWNVFENCIIRSRSGGGQAGAFFITDAVTDTVVDYTAIFLNCQFLHQGTALTLGISKGANTSRKLYFDNRCTFAGVTDIVADARNAEVEWGAAGASPDGAALNDKLYLGIGQTPIHTAS